MIDRFDNSEAAQEPDSKIKLNKKMKRNSKKVSEEGKINQLNDPVYMQNISVSESLLERTDRINN
jgi:hypothetical protein